MSQRSAVTAAPMTNAAPTSAAIASATRRNRACSAGSSRGNANTRRGQPRHDTHQNSPDAAASNSTFAPIASHHPVLVDPLWSATSAPPVTHNAAMRPTTRHRLPAASVLHVGDSRRDDVEGARAIGMHALWLTRDSARGDLRTLAELPERLRSGELGD